MTKDSRDLSGASAEFLGAAWFDPIEAVRRPRYQRAGATNVASGTARYRHVPIAWFVRAQLVGQLDSQLLKRATSLIPRRGG